MVPLYNLVLFVSLQCKCEQYWSDDLDKPFNAGTGISVVTTRCRGFADYEIRDLTVRNVRRLTL